jgi:hypothetical protein
MRVSLQFCIAATIRMAVSGGCTLREHARVCACLRQRERQAPRSVIVSRVRGHPMNAGRLMMALAASACAPRRDSRLSESVELPPAVPS